MWAATQVLACTPLVTALIGRRSSGVPGQIEVNMFRVTSPCSWLTALTPAAVRMARAVMLNCGPDAVVVGAERHEPLAVLAQAAPGAGHVRLDQREGERVVAGRHRRVRREHRGRADLRERRVEGRALLDVVPDALQRDEGRVALVQVPDGGLDAHGLERPHAAEAEDDLLLEAHVLVAAVQPRRQLAVPRRVLLDVGVEQEQPHLAGPDLPHRRMHGPRAERHRRRRTASRRDGWPAASGASSQSRIS